MSSKVVLVSPSPRALAPGQGGVENILIAWAGELSRRGHQVIAASIAGDTPGATKTSPQPWQTLVVERPQDLASLEADLYSFHQFPEWISHTPQERTWLMLHNRPTLSGPFGIFPPAPDWDTALRSLREAPNLLACSNWLAAQITEISARDGIGVIHPPLDEAFIRAAEVPKERFVLFAGRLLWRKGLRELAELAADNAFGVPLLVTDFAPQSVRSQEAQQIRTLLQNTANLELVPPATNSEEMATLMARAGAMLLPSLGEPFGMVAIEAQAAGTRVVAWQEGGLVETAGEAMTLVPVGDKTAFVEAVRQAIVDPVVDQATRQAIAVRFSVSNSVDALLTRATQPAIS